MLIHREIHTYNKNSLTYNPRQDEVSYNNYKCLALCIAGKSKEGRRIYPSAEDVIRFLRNNAEDRPKKPRKRNINIYTIINTKTGEIIENKNSNEVSEIIGLNSDSVSSYSSNGYLYKKIYKIIKLGEIK